MAYSVHASRPIVLRTSRETIALVVGATLVTFALSNAIHAHRRPSTTASGDLHDSAFHQDWTGQLADVAANDVTASATPFTSASLVVPQSELALPRMPVRPLVKLHGCEGSACMAKPGTTVVRKPAAVAQRDERMGGLSIAELSPTRMLLRREAPNAGAPARQIRETKTSLMSRVNPLRHLPDMSTIKRPFAYAGETVSSWFK